MRSLFIVVAVGHMIQLGDIRAKKEHLWQSVCLK
jgi:hypothetical protein